MLAFLCNITDKLNKIVTAVNNVQLTIGLESDSSGTVLGRLNRLKDVVMVVDEVTISDNKLTTTEVVKDNVCVGNRIDIDYGDGTETMYKGVTINGNTIELVDANGEFDGLVATVTYLTEKEIGA